MTQSLYYLTYSSNIAIRQIFSPNCIKDIVDESLEFNPKNSITGFLCYDSLHFFQYIEGPKETIEHLFDKLKHDKRHRNIKLHMTGDITRRRFHNWSMLPMHMKRFSKDFQPSQNFIPFRPYDWDNERCHDFVGIFEKFYRTPQAENLATFTEDLTPINMDIKGTLRQHQAFLMVQLVLLTLIVTFLYAFFKMDWQQGFSSMLSFAVF